MNSESHQRNIDDIITYHQLSKHNVNLYAPGPTGLDWANQPNPIRNFSGCETIPLPLRADNLKVPFTTISRGSGVSPAQITLENIAVFLEISLGISVWKSYNNSRWALRCNPSSGNLHPTEAYIVVGSVDDLSAGVYHYLSYNHALECRAKAKGESSMSELSTHGFFIGLTTIFWREAWKYGIRAFRYCQHDCGHAIAALHYAAATLGWDSHLLNDCDDHDTAKLLGLDRECDYKGAEREVAQILLWIGKNTALPNVAAIPRALEELTWFGHANKLSAEHVEWSAIDVANVKSYKPLTKALIGYPNEYKAKLVPPKLELAATHLFRQRRSAVAFDQTANLNAPGFFTMLDALLPRPGLAPWRDVCTRPMVHLALFVHRITGLTPGLYFLCRAPEALHTLKHEISNSALWQNVENCPAHIPLYLLAADDLRRTAEFICCHQEIAADAAFSLGFISEFREALSGGAWCYRRLLWEAGFLGQILYLEAEAAGMRATGIGCYFDDAMHSVLGLNSNCLQSLYHFTVGMPIEDTRLITERPYGHRECTHHP